MNEQRLAIYKYFYFLGIGGIGMSALARYFNSKGFVVAGYDKTPSELTDALEKEGIAIHFEDEVNHIPAVFLDNKKETLVVYTPAIPKDHREYNYLIEKGFKIEKRALVLAMVTEGKHTIAVAGTHGKTSTATLISHILKTAGIPFYAFLGGISSNYATNFMAPDNHEDAGVVVVEADEFDRSFHRLNPDISIITAIESDHLDIYGTVENLKEAFYEFARKTNEGGQLISQADIILTAPENVRHLTYSAYEKADIWADNIHIANGKYQFNANTPSVTYENLSIGVPGMHNIENSLAAIAATQHLVNRKADYYKALDSFKGVWRRFEVIVRNHNIVYIDDYAHHPTEIKATLQTIKKLYPGKYILGIFQPHLFTRTRDLAHDFADSLSILDELILLPIYPARELPIPGVSSQMILDEVHCNKKQIVEKEFVVAMLAGTRVDVIVTLGAGDIDRLVHPIKELLEKEYKSSLN